jgi:hypothetical protein
MSSSGLFVHLCVEDLFAAYGATACRCNNVGWLAIPYEKTQVRDEGGDAYLFCRRNLATRRAGGG